MLFASINLEAHRAAAWLVKLLSKFYQISLVSALIVSLFTGISGCSQEFIKSVQDTTEKISQSLQKIQSFQSVLVDKYHDKKIGVEVSYTSTEKGWVRFINVQFTNTSFNELTDSERAKIAKEVAELAKVHFGLDKPEDSVSVNFVDSQNYVVFQFSRVIDSYTLHPSKYIAQSVQ